MKYNFLILFSILYCLNLNAQDLSKTMTVAPGTSISIAAGTTLSAAELNLKSTSDSFSSVMLDGTITPSTVVNYDRYVNVVGTSGVNGGNDLISLPVKTSVATFGDFLNYSADYGSTTNSATMPTNGSVYAFGPYDNGNRSYTNYASATVGNGDVLERAVGYRAATNLGGTLRFTGTISKVTETVSITTAEEYKWNSVGNPYPTYLDSQAFLTENASSLDEEAGAIYAYNNGAGSGPGVIGNFTIINDLVNTTWKIAPGQGFLVANAGTTPNDINFTTSMRVFSGEDDFIAGRDENVNQMLRLKAEHSNANFATEIYFNNNSSIGLDPGYDARLFGESSLSFSLYSHLVEDNVGTSMAIQSLGTSDVNDVVIPLGLKVAQGQQVTLSIENTTLPNDVEVYLEDNLTNTFTLLNEGNYTFVANTTLAGTGRFYLRVGNSTLSQIDNALNSLNLYAANQKIFVKGQLLETTQVDVYDTLGRLVMGSSLETGSHTNEIDATQLNAGIYVVKLTNGKQELTKKVILK
ncbi:TonB-dependent receptor [Winogradskyella psychrotolerans RS-3]|uniref:TonB-dependent receptor n=1 Tax=Winogradskyella psychrotolerans RS-3 TaxID=641526 RepID=S7VQC1_9FLAO|nr:T9SS type A sorting domain-containing protein [Winogradskyella psychrotolerans]EPR72455.1 TonB-dependent receptor [Winogradskyella psychrotolerans RS-3]